MEGEEFEQKSGDELWKLPAPTPAELKQMKDGLYFCDYCLEPLDPDQDRYCSRACECLDEDQ